MKKSKKWTTIQDLFGIIDVDDHATVLRKLREGFDINTVDSGGRTLLMEAVIQKDHELIEVLLENGADVNIRDKRKWTALHFAAQEYDLTATNQLIQQGADVNAQDDYGNSVILKSLSNSRGRGEVIKYLLEHGADMNVKNNSGISALDSAERTSNYDVAQFYK